MIIWSSPLAPLCPRSNPQDHELSQSVLRSGGFLFAARRAFSRKYLWLLQYTSYAFDSITVATTSARSNHTSTTPRLRVSDSTVVTLTPSILSGIAAISID